MALSTPTDDELVVALARATVERAAPEEMVIFPAASEAYLEGQDPAKRTRGDPMLGFGVDSAVLLLTPIALTVAKDVVVFLRAQLAKQAEEHSDDVFDWLVDKLFRRDDDKAADATNSASVAAEPVAAAELTDEQLEEVRQLAIEKAKQLKLSDDKAELLADSLVGSLATA